MSQKKRHDVELFYEIEILKVKLEQMEKRLELLDLDNRTNRAEMMQLLAMKNSTKAQSSYESNESNEIDSGDELDMSPKVSTHPPPQNKKSTTQLQRRFS